MYREIIRETAARIGLAGIDPAGIEGHMRLQYGTLDHLTPDDFGREIEMAARCEAAEPGYLSRVAAEHGLVAAERGEANR